MLPGPVKCSYALNKQCPSYEEVSYHARLVECTTNGTRRLWVCPFKRGANKCYGLDQPGVNDRTTNCLKNSKCIKLALALSFHSNLQSNTINTHTATFRLQERSCNSSCRPVSIYLREIILEVRTCLKRGKRHDGTIVMRPLSDSCPPMKQNNDSTNRRASANICGKPSGNISTIAETWNVERLVCAPCS